MIEFVAQDNGAGRHLYNEDLLNLQELALSFTKIFEECGRDFVISGCEITKNGSKIFVNEGYVWLDGKIRQVSKTEVSTVHPLYIAVLDTYGETIPYVTQGIAGNQYIEYGAVVQKTKPSGRCIKTKSATFGFENIASEFFSYYAITKGIGDQETNANVQFQQSLTIKEKRIGDKLNYVAMSGDETSLTLKFFDTGVFVRKMVLDIKKREFSVYDSNNNLIHQFGENFDGDVILPTISTTIVNSNVLKSKTLKLQSVDTDDCFHIKKDTGWLPVVNADMIYARQVYRDVYITGRLSLANVTFLTESNHLTYWSRRTSLKLPPQITPPASTSEYIFNVRGGDLQHNGSTNWKIWPDGSFVVESDGDMLMSPIPSSFIWHYYV